MVKTFYIDYQYVPATAITSIRFGNKITAPLKVYLVDGRVLEIGRGYWDLANASLIEEIKAYFGITE